MLLTILTFVHVLISFAGILSGLAVLFGLFTGKRLDRWTVLFLTTTVATSITGFFFSVHHFMPSHAAGILSLVVLAIAIHARYARKLNGVWRKIYAITAMVALYLNVFVAVVQAFQKLPALKVLAPTQSEPPFKLTQLVVLTLFVVLTFAGAIRFRDKPIHTT
ncbi:hypothetical protein [Pedosphaera parvula]|uniref:DUF2306 domain-containing protein n=1 Tax=Pedosphaera parvula (strain Ellin514) TaxID=320771 RepID=B9XAH2_PEDPL|nr:hypothetical protein [Pedosphaera parvula]EEF63007.1 conserved hypothetical protein [Pedosphaera parvula Ellin514]